MSPRDCRSYRALMVTPEGNSVVFSQIRSQKTRVVQCRIPIHKAANLPDSKACAESSPLSFLVCEILRLLHDKRKERYCFCLSTWKKIRVATVKLARSRLVPDGALGMARMREALKTQSVQNGLWGRMWCLRTWSRAKTLHMNIK